MSKFSKQHYLELERFCREQKLKASVVLALAEMLAKDNPAFDSQRFIWFSTPAQPQDIDHPNHP